MLEAFCGSQHRSGSPNLDSAVHFEAMFRVLLRLAVVLLGLTVGQAGAELCLDDGVPESQRKYIQAGCKACMVLC